MARNRIQFQKGFSEPEFNAQYGQEKRCAEALEALHWPQGFVALSAVTIKRID